MTKDEFKNLVVGERVAICERLHTVDAKWRDDLGELIVSFTPLEGHWTETIGEDDRRIQDVAELTSWVDHLK